MSHNKTSLVFATNNAHKLSEMQRIVGENFDILSLADIGCADEIPENENTLEGNALAKARWIKERYGFNCFADDTGLEVEALNGDPGVKSARYASDTAHDSVANMQLLLKNLADAKNRVARFRTVIALIDDTGEHLFEGIVNGQITDSPIGENGFGYDPVFMPEGYNLTFAQLDTDIKNSISHRARATAGLLEFLNRI